ncbi:MAG: hypothetical protein IGS48_23225 [Oscillatoriales cyanobacterium C42_A2020_001]|nr:hypothetical protein [Leptolyngbyaceae cyanobacterium C42_A2020_001]
MIDSFIPSDLAVAPNPPGLASSLRLVTVPVDAYNFFELWMPPEEASLIPEEAMLLKDDRLRLEEICGKLMWLLGADLLSGDKICTQEPLYDWQSLMRLIHQSGQHFDAITVHYSPQTIRPSNQEGNRPCAWTIAPSTWCISFLEFSPVERGYQPNPLPLSVAITYGKPLTRRMETANAGMRYT